MSLNDTRFKFGANWQNFLENINEERINVAELSIKKNLTLPNLKGLKFIDIGCGSGLFSLSARNLGARVHSFDFDQQSVDCAKELHQRFHSGDKMWTIEQGSILDEKYLSQLGLYDVVYSWGVLHHTGNLWRALEFSSKLVKPGGKLFISIYNDQGIKSVRWTKIKKYYSSSPKWRQRIISYLSFLRIWGPQLVRDILRGRGLSTWKNYGTDRGMSAWNDLIDWVGGYPFEVAKPEEIFDFFSNRGFVLEKLKTCGGGWGCNEFVFSLSKNR